MADCKATILQLKKKQKMKSQSSCKFLSSFEKKKNGSFELQYAGEEKYKRWALKYNENSIYWETQTFSLTEICLKVTFIN